MSFSVAVTENNRNLKRKISQSRAMDNHHRLLSLVIKIEEIYSLGLAVRLLNGDYGQKSPSRDHFICIHSCFHLA